MTDLSLQDKKQLILEAIQNVEYLADEVPDQRPIEDGEWEVIQYKKYLINKLGVIEYDIQNSTTDTEENNNDTIETETTEEETNKETTL